MCRFCEGEAGDSAVERRRVLNLLSLVEAADALPAEAALRIAGELLAWAGSAGQRLRCEAVGGVGVS